MENPNQPILYIFMRNDMASMTTGRCMAQASHASNQFVHDDKLHHAPLIQEWEQETYRGFGTTIVLAADIETINARLDAIPKNGDTWKLAYGWITDPDYGIRDGNTVHSLQIITCAYIFGRRNDCTQYTKDLPLYP